jgi:hypothetical protein
MVSKDNGKARSEVGVAWQRGDSFSIQLRPGTVLSHRDCSDHWISLYPNTSKAPHVKDAKASSDPGDDGYDVEMNF